MDSKKISSLSIKLCDSEAILGMLNSGEPVAVSFDNGGEPVRLSINITTTSTSAYKMSELFSRAITGYREELLRDLLHEVRPG